jgi:hypothetical protein
VAMGEVGAPRHWTSSFSFLCRAIGVVWGVLNCTQYGSVWQTFFQQTFTSKVATDQRIQRALMYLGYFELHGRMATRVSSSDLEKMVPSSPSLVLLFCSTHGRVLMHDML